MRKTKLNLKTIKELDKSSMMELLKEFPLQCQMALELAKKVSILFENRSFNKIVFAGLGGSAIGADLVRTYLYFESRAPILILREYDLPAFVDDSTLIFIASYSGNTEETLSAYDSAKKISSNIIAISSNGALQERCRQDNITFAQIPKGLPPRCALGYMSIIPLYLLSKLGIIKDVSQSISKMIKVLEDLRNKHLDPKIGLKDNQAKYIANILFNKFAVIYSASIHFDVAAVRLRGQLAENSKALASSHFFPEMNHNEIVGWQNPKKLFKDFIVLMLRDKQLHPRVAKRMDISQDILREEEVKTIEIWSRGEDLLSRIFSLIYIGDFVSFYLAILYGIDPTPVDRVTYLKNQLAKDSR